MKAAVVRRMSSRLEQAVTQLAPACCISRITMVYWLHVMQGVGQHRVE
jgi:hypothetical protein